LLAVSSRQRCGHSAGQVASWSDQQACHDVRPNRDVPDQRCGDWHRDVLEVPVVMISATDAVKRSNGHVKQYPLTYQQPVKLCRRLYLIESLLVLLRRTRTVLFCACKVSLQSLDIMLPKSLLSIIIIIIISGHFQLLPDFKNLNPVHL